MLIVETRYLYQSLEASIALIILALQNTNSTNSVFAGS